MVRSTSSKAPRSTRRSIGNVGSPPCAATRPLWDSGLRLSPPSKLEPAAVKSQPEETSPNPGRGEIPRRSWSKNLSGTGRTPRRSGSSLGGWTGEIEPSRERGDHLSAAGPVPQVVRSTEVADTVKFLEEPLDGQALAPAAGPCPGPDSPDARLHRLSTPNPCGLQQLPHPHHPRRRPPADPHHPTLSQ